MKRKQDMQQIDDFLEELGIIKKRMSFVGTAKQVKWADTIYQDLLEQHGPSSLPKINLAEFWISNRNADLDTIHEAANIAMISQYAIAPRQDRRSIAQSALKALSTEGILFLDTETTGLGKGGEIVSIAIANQKEEIFSSYVKPMYAKMSESARKVNGITDDQIESAPTIAEIWSELSVIFSECRAVVAYNASFDKAMLARSLQCAGIDTFQIEKVIWVDFMKICTDFFCSIDNYKLSELAEKLNVEIEHAHTAGGDVQTMIACYEELVKQC
jgi:DNA polymerase III alpha subunit (gram-positive type)